MKARFLIPVCMLILAVVIVFLWPRIERTEQTPDGLRSTRSSGTFDGTRVSDPASNWIGTHIAPGPGPGADARAIALAKHWIDAAKPFDCDPTIKRVVESKHPATGRVVEYEVLTENYSIQIRPRPDGDIVHAAVGFLSDKTTPEHEKKWYLLTGRWSEQQAVTEAYSVLQRLGAIETLAQIAGTNFEATPLPLLRPDGSSVTNTPFINVRFFDKKGERIVDAQYRMEPDHPGLVRWWHWPATVK